jgi:antitoxin (DNA-binding transcriptional repressor) of toxin-antitoxin stability system
MRTVDLSELQNKLSEYVRLAASGETVLITDSDQVVAEMRPPQIGRSANAADVSLEDAIRKGWITPATIVSKEPPPRKAIGIPFCELMRHLDQDREDR